MFTKRLEQNQSKRLQQALRDSITKNSKAFLNSLRINTYGVCPRGTYESCELLNFIEDEVHSPGLISLFVLVFCPLSMESLRAELIFPPFNLFVLSFSDFGIVFYLRVVRPVFRTSS